MDQVQPYIQPAFDYLKNPYIVGVVGIIAIVYGSLMAPQLPPSVAAWFDNPIFKVLFIFLILAVRNISPTVSILLALGLIISMQTLNRYRVFSMANKVSQMTAQKPVVPARRIPAVPVAPTVPSVPAMHPTEDEMHQMNQEMTQEMMNQKQQQNLQGREDIMSGQEDINAGQQKVAQGQRKVMESNYPFVKGAGQIAQGALDIVGDVGGLVKSGTGQARDLVGNVGTLVTDSTGRVLDLVGNVGSLVTDSTGRVRSIISGEPAAANQVKQATVPQRKVVSMDAKEKPVEALHPMNRPTVETSFVQPRVEDPNDPEHPGWRKLYTPNVDVSIYELNPPFLRKNLPNQFLNPKGAIKMEGPPIYPPQFENKIQPGIIPPRHGASRYSAVHGYPVLPQTASPQVETPTGLYMKGGRILRDINDNMPSPIVPVKEQQLPQNFMQDPVLPSYENSKIEVGSKLNPHNGNYMGPQGLSYQSGYPGPRQGAAYGK